MAVALAGLMAGCAANTGDFGRPRAGVWDSTIAPAIGYLSALQREEAASSFPFTDDENELRDRAWRLIMPAHERNYFARQISELAHARILPVALQSDDKADYHNGLLRGSFRSPASRYNRLTDDALADRALVGPFHALARRVIAADRLRMRVMDDPLRIEPAKTDEAVLRIVENEGLMLWVCERMKFRLENYHYALTNLTVEMPSQEALRAERAVMALKAEAGSLCNLPLIGAFGPGNAPVTRPARPAIYKS